MRKPNELFTLIQNTTYTDTGDSLSWNVTVSDSEKAIFLIFQQSDGKIDWKNNLDFWSKTYNLKDKITVARGWGNAWKSANDTVMDALIKAHTSYPEYTVWVIGWSYGGAIAPLACEDFWYRTGGKNSGIKSMLVTFGAPESLYGEETRKYIVDNCIIASYQFCVINDMVTYLPPFKKYCRINTISIGSKFSLIEFISVVKNHTSYGNEDLYKNIVWNY